MAICDHKTFDRAYIFIKILYSAYNIYGYNLQQVHIKYLKSCISYIYNRFAVMSQMREKKS